MSILHSILDDTCKSDSSNEKSGQNVRLQCGQFTATISAKRLSAKTGKQNFPARQNFQGLFPHVKIQEDIGNSSCWTRVDPFLRCALLDICFGILIVFFDDANFKCCTFFATFLVILYDVTYFHFPVRCP